MSLEKQNAQLNSSAELSTTGLLEPLGINVCATCGRTIGDEEKQHVQTSRIVWITPEGESKHGKPRSYARCTECGPPDEFPDEFPDDPGT